MATAGSGPRSRSTKGKGTLRFERHKISHSVSQVASARSSHGARSSRCAISRLRVLETEHEPTKELADLEIPTMRKKISAEERIG